MSNVWQHIQKSLAAGKSCALISVVETKGSTPREVGARIVLNDQGGFHGTIGGGNLENASIQKAQKLLTENTQQIHLQKHLLGPDMGQCCGGAVTVLIEVFTPNQLPEIEPFAKAELYGEFYILGDITEHSVSRKITLNSDPLGLDSVNILGETFAQKQTPIYLFGAGHVGKALMLHLASLPFDVTWVDSRKAEFPKAVPANFTMHCLNQPHKILAQAPDNAQIFILTHDHDVDFEIVSTALQMDRFAYVGMIGSKTKKARFISKFKKLGMPQNIINQMTTPIGLTTIKSKKPQSVAISIIADLLSRIEI